MPLPAGTEATLAAQASSDSETLAGEGKGLRAEAAIERGALLGRYVVLDRLGRGGMGVVYAAYDPELDRKVALKLLLPCHGDGGGDDAVARARLQREAQALARLGHPNVVSIHDVGTIGERVYLAMEFVEGHTLGAWLSQRPRKWREVLAVVLAAGEGLAAAHVKGLVHRDVKPDNVMVGDDGRVRVMDFGLARTRDELHGERPELAAGVTLRTDLLSSELTVAGAVVGTPAYMAPEQFAGRGVDARSDQFSLCATAWEALYGQRAFAGETLAELVANVMGGSRVPPPARSDVPAWLRRVLERGLQVRPEDRYPDNGALLAALRADPTPRRRWIVAAVGVVALAAAGLGVHDAARRRAVAACEAEGAAIAEVWNADARADVERAFLATGRPLAATTFAKTVPWLEGWAASWQAAAEAACRAHAIDETWDDELRARAEDCLQEARGELATLVQQLREADTKQLLGATTAAAGLPTVGRCTEPAMLRVRPVLSPEQRDEWLAVQATFARASSLADVGELEQALALGQQGLEAAKATGSPALVAQAEVRVGRLEMSANTEVKAEASLLRGLAAAREARAAGVLLEATIVLVSVVGQHGSRPAEGVVWAEAAQSQLALLAVEQPLDQATLDTNLGVLRKILGEHAEALRLLERALAVRERVLGSEHPQVAASLNNLANTHKARGAHEEAARTYERAIEVWTRALGEQHPNVAMALSNLAGLEIDRGDYAAAEPRLRRAIEIWEHEMGPDYSELALGLNNLANLHASRHELDEAVRHYERALAIWERGSGPEHPRLVALLGNLAGVYAAKGEYDAAIALRERALAIAERSYGPDHIIVGKAFFHLASVRTAKGDPVEAKRLYERALAIQEQTLGPDHESVADSLAGLGEVVAALGVPAEAQTLHERALTIRERVYGPDHRTVAESLHNLAVVDLDLGRFETALLRDSRALEIWERGLGQEHVYVAYALQGMGLAQLGLGRPADAIAPLERALAVRQAGAVPPEYIADTRFALARALWDADVDRRRARELAEAAREVYEGIASRGKPHADVVAWLRKHGR